MDINKRLKEELNVELWQIEAAVKLIDEGNTIPFISRYRKEATGALNDEVLRKLYERLNYLRNLEEKKKQVLSSIEEQGKLTEELKNQILEAETLVVVEDLYRPYRPKRRTSYDCKGKRIRTFCKLDFTAGNTEISFRRGRSFCVRRKRSKNSGRSGGRCA